MAGLAQTLEERGSQAAPEGGRALHVCFLCGEYPPGRHGGVGMFTQTMGRALVARGHRVSVVGVYPRTDTVEEDDQGVRVVRLAHTNLRGLGFVVHGARIRSAIARIHRQQPIDVLDGPELSQAVVDPRLPAAKVIRINGGHHFFMTALGTPLSPWLCWQEKRSFRRADALCAASHFVGERTRALLHLGPQPIEVLPNPVDTDYFRPRPEVPTEDGLIVFVGTVCEKKGVRQLVQAMPQILRRAPHAKLEIVGPDHHDARTGQSYVEDLRAHVPEARLEQVRFVGAVPNAQLPEVLARASVCVYPSHMEALGVAWIEGMAMGKAVVGGNLGPGPEVIEEGVSGLLCNPYDPASIGAAISTLLADGNLRDRLGACARQRAVELFSTEALVERNVAFYRRCVQNTHGR